MRFHTTQAMVLALLALCLPACREAEGQTHEESHAVIVTCPEVKQVIATEQYVCQIHSRRHIEIRALESGYLQEIPVKEGQLVKQGDLLFKLLPTLYQAKFESEAAEAQLAQIEFENTRTLFEQHVVSDREVALAKAKLAKAQAQVSLAKAELNFTDIRAPFDGIIDRLHEQQGSLIEEGAMLTSLSDNSVMWVYFNVPEARYLEYKADLAKSKGEVAAGADSGGGGDDDAEQMEKHHEQFNIELVLANGNTFHQPGKIGAIEGEFNNETGNIAFRADFPNPDGLLRHGQTGSVLIHRPLDNAIVIPQRATFEILDKRYVYVLDEKDEVHQSEIEVLHEMEDIFVIRSGVKPTDKIVLEGLRQVHEGEKVEYEFRKPDEVLSELKNEAE